MESLRTVISRLFADAQDPGSTPLEDTNRKYCGYFSRRPPKRRRVSVLHPDLNGSGDPFSSDDSAMIAYLLQTSRLDYDALAHDFLRASVVGNMSEQLKVIMLKYREPPLTLVKTTRLLAFLNHLLMIKPITPKIAAVTNTNAATAATPGTATGSGFTNSAAGTHYHHLHHHPQQQQPFPLGQLFEDLTLTLSLRNVQSTGANSSNSSNNVPLLIWVVTLQFMLSCLRNNSLQALYNAGIATPVILGIIKHILLELTRLPATNMSAAQKKCFGVGKQMLDLFLIRDPQPLSSAASLSQTPGQQASPMEQSPTSAALSSSTSSGTTIGNVSYYDVVYSFPELYGHFLNSAQTSTNPQPAIANHNIWLMTLQYMITSITQDHRMFERSPTLMVAVNIIKHVLREINTLPANLSTAQVNCLNKGKELINLLLLGPMGDGAGVVSHYDIIVALPDVYGDFLHGHFAQSIHWTMEKFINELGKRRRHLAFLMMPPDASWPLISQLSRRHEYNDLTTRTSFHMFKGDLIEFVKEGNSTNIETHFRDMLFQRASMDEFRQLELSLTQSGYDTTQIRKAMVAKVRDVLQCIQQHNTAERRQGHDSSSQKGRGGADETVMNIPSYLDLWELMNETADQLYSFVTAEYFTYEDILQDFYALVYQPNGEEYPPGAKYHLSKDNGLIWLLLQLFFIDKVAQDVISVDFNGDERLFGKLVALYNEDQAESEDAFSFRDLALQCSIYLERLSIKDITNLKMRHPRVASSLQYTSVCHKIMTYFGDYYHSNVTDPSLFHNLDIQEITKIAVHSQTRRDALPFTLYVYLVPTNPEIATAGNPESTYAKGGSVSYKILDLIGVAAKHKLLQLMYKMMLLDDGPRYQSNTQRGTQMQITSVSPKVIDAAYKLLYSAPCSSELMIKEIFDRIRRCDRVYKARHEEELAGITPDKSLTVERMRWLHTMLQMMNYRFIRYLKFSSISSGLFHYIRYSVSYLEHRQIYRVLEQFVFNLARMQMDVKLLRSLDDPNREKPIWFAESETVARAVVTSISRLIKTRGQADIKTEQIYRVLASLFEYRLDWSPESIKYFPDAVKKFYTDPQSPNQRIPARPAINPMNLKQQVMNNKFLLSYLLQGSKDHEQMMIQTFSKAENQASLLCIIWTIAVMRNSIDVFEMSSVRKLLLLVLPARVDTHAVDLVDYILKVDYSSASPELPFKLLDTMIWKYQWVNFTNIISALGKGSGTPERTTKAFRYVQYLLLESPEFKKRVDKWLSLGFSHRYWTEEDFHEKLMQYLTEYPEYHEYEAFAVAQQNTQQPVLDPPLQPQMPVYYTSIVSDFVPFLEVLIARLIEYAQTDLLLQILDRYGQLFYYHNSPLSYVCNLLLYYYPNDTLSDPRVCKRIVRLLDFKQYDVAPEAVAYAQNDDLDGDVFNAGYYERVIHKLTNSLNPKKCAPKSDPKLPERHFREIGSPAVQGITIAMLEIILTPVPPSMTIKYILDLVLQRGAHQVGVSALTIHATGLLLASLPAGHFVRPIWEELSNLIMHDPCLLEVSEPCRLIRCGMPKRTNGKYFMSQSLPDLISTAVLRDSMSSRLRKAMVHPYVFNDYTYNMHNYSTNTPNCFLAFFHSLLHYSSLDIFPVFLEYLRSLRQTPDILKTDVQLLYVCFLLGPALHRIEKLDNNNTDAEFLIELMHMVKQITMLMDMKDGWSTQALEQTFDFLHHIRAGFVKSPELASQLREIIKSMNAPISQRLIRLVHET
ncbi:mediator complex subunit 23-domain-containing protein [Zychaea mexicana]|uniref:mediator complex subunit 23-domain-containing protein n=1 Tax=Zychaea mexicana TaxID=64656 RepID=UPI0022FDDAEE|nr:mediator complex subunit 23-domain-containing protein [Zychaea mexicana]KAI9492493.1 mediator complex subunit 23-domain-containing protein [Zychaea mexicana]